MRRQSPTKTTLRIDVKPAVEDAPPRRGVLTLLSGTRPGMIIPLHEGQLTIGRTDEAMIELDDDSLSRLHARFSHVRGEYFVEDLQSTNGTFVNNAPISERIALENGARIQLGLSTILRFTLQDDAELEARRSLYEASVRDALTGVFNRHFLDERLASELSYAKRHGTMLSILFVDADHFKRVNDTLGHAAGDQVLRRLAAALLETMRSEDVVARFGGEEFVLVVRGISAIGVLAVAERVRAVVEALEIVYEAQRIAITVSVGVATQCPEREFATVEELLAVADGALYRAKEAGRNRCFLA